MNKLLFPAAGLAGALAVAWVAAGYLQGHPLALAMTLLIGAVYAAGVAELLRHQRATLGLQKALDQLPAGDSTPFDAGALATWLAALPALLREPVARRVQASGRAPLPAPAMAPYLTGLLVLLGMLGTFAGMIVTLRGTGLALESAGDVATLRDSLAAPVRGLGLAFGASVAGVAASAALGLMAALARRSRTAALQALDAHIAGTLLPHTRAHQQQQAREAQRAQEAAAQQAQQAAQLAAQQAQAEALRALVTQLQQQSQAANEALLQRQQHFHETTAQTTRALADSVDSSLQRSLAGAAQQAAATLQPAVQAAMDGIARETAALHGAVRSAVQQQLDGLAARFEAQATAWVAAVGTQQQQQTQALLQALGDAQAQQQARQTAAEQRAAETEQARLAAYTTALEQMALQLQQRTQAMTAQAEAQARGTLDEVARLVQSVENHAVEAPRAAAEVVAQLREQLSRSLAQDSALLEERSRTAAALGSLIGGVQQQLDGLTQSFERQSSTWVAAVGAQVQQHTGAMLQALQAQQEATLAAQQAHTAEADTQRLAQFSAALQQMAEQLQQRTGEMVAQAETQARATIAEVAQVVQAAGEAPRAAAELAAQLREQFSQSLVQDNTRLAEREQLLAALQAVLAELQAGASAQQGAVQALVEAGTRVLGEAETRVQAQAEAEAARLQAVAAQLGASAVDVASLGEAFGAAVGQFAQGSDQMLAQLQRVEEALARAGARSDEQLAYYVAQAREVIDLSLLSQKQIVDDLQRLAAPREGAAPEAAAA
ncbi:DUF802 domain-containing protein [Rubrivivax rivuli]|uniref:DUF802 domain-containing protein n=1 Tax=Rubrivivax rivuli TaxID=1862385 RepID=A0A437RRD6_9BURK|nr:DUF802 domain-containing protein [Rubrivivax rivuli]RVU49366.1 DUF802 domain-containing protein [Rubrivivax rivuli]